MLFHANPEIRFVELVRNVPPQSPKFPPLLDNGVEETQPEEELLPGVRLVAAFEEAGVRDGVIEIGTQEVSTESFGWLICHLNSCRNGGWVDLRAVY